ncbi:MAG: GIY-YIG nuclease family protein [Coriobacteriia bacterium]|nr:GIY-YIG nuclease family protein [Coriobacteriia bacterium]
MEAKPGTYALVLRSHSWARTQIDRWGHLDIEPGYYIYVGSAFGPGGVRARVLRHCRAAGSRHWHIDYLREFVTPVFAWYSHDPARLEHRWAQALAGMKGMTPIKGFGCSDCDCQSHLFHTVAEPDLARFATTVGGPVETWLKPNPVPGARATPGTERA